MPAISPASLSTVGLFVRLLGANLHDSGEYTVWWRADQTDVEGRVTRALLGNGLLERRHYDEASGQLTSLRVGGVKANLLRSGHGDVLSHDYQYDALDSMTRRRDLLLDRTLDYRYDNHDRLTGVTQVTRGSTGTVGANGTETFGLSYNAHGDILRRTASGRAHAYAYGAVSASGAGARTLQGALSGFTPAGGSRVTVRYDANGNLLNSASASAIRWTSYNKPASITARKGGATYRYRYDGARMLFLRESGGQQTFLLGKGYEEDLRGDGRRGERRYFIYAGGGAVARHTVPGAGSADPTTRTHYFHKDALGSVAALTDHLGKLAQRFVYKLGGEQQVLFTAADFAELTRGGVPARFAPLTRRGYTGHGAGAGVQLVDMNGRYYDAQMMRFVSADPFVQSPNIAASHNRYSYAWNNPNKYTDPSGYFFKRLVKFWRDNWRTIVVIAVVVAVTFFTGGFGAVALWQVVLSGAASAFAGAFVGVRLHGGTWNQALKAGLKQGAQGAASSLAFYGVGKLGSLGKMSDGARLAMRSAMHGAATAMIAAAKGGNSRDFWAGFASGAISKAFGPNYKAGDTGWVTFGKAMQAAAVGGTTSKISGGSFENGAVTAAFAYLFNSAGEKAEAEKSMPVFETPEAAAVAGLTHAFHNPKHYKGRLLSLVGGIYKVTGGFAFGYRAVFGMEELRNMLNRDALVAWFITYPYDPDPPDYGFSEEGHYNYSREKLGEFALELNYELEGNLGKKIPIYLLTSNGAIKRYETVTGTLYGTTIMEKESFTWPRK